MEPQWELVGSVEQDEELKASEDPMIKVYRIWFEKFMAYSRSAGLMVPFEMEAMWEELEETYGDRFQRPPGFKANATKAYRFSGFVAVMKYIIAKTCIDRQETIVLATKWMKEKVRKALEPIEEQDETTEVGPSPKKAKVTPE